MDSTVLSDVVAYLHGRMQTNRIPAVGLALVRSGEIIAVRGLGTANLEWELPATGDTAFQLASATKPLTGTLLMMAVERGELRLDAPLKAYLPHAPPSWDAITVRHLATHTSGIADDPAELTQTHVPGQDGTPGVLKSAGTVAEAAMHRALAYEPGTDVRYALTDFVVLTVILETVTGMPFQALLRARLLDPLGMTSTHYDNGIDESGVREADIVPRRAATYRSRGEELRDFRFFYPTWGYAAGGLLSSVSDLARWLAALDGGELLTTESMKEMWSPQTLIDGSPGLFSPGWVVYTHRGRQVFGHSGGPALGDIMHFPEEDLSVVVLCNQQNVMPDLAPGVADILHVRTTYAQARAALRTGNIPPSHDACPPESYTGSYAHPERGVITVARQDTALAMTHAGETFPLRHLHGDIFSWDRVRSDDATPVYFTMGPAGDIDGLAVAMEPDAAPDEFRRVIDASSLDLAMLAHCTGTYDLMGTSLTVTLEGEHRLAVHIPGQPRMLLEALRGTTFSVAGAAGTTLEFQFDDGGNAVGAVFRQPMGEVVAQRQHS
jgi:CubicO group peptidase (beta-lactamase class C family)